MSPAEVSAADLKAFTAALMADLTVDVTLMDVVPTLLRLIELDLSILANGTVSQSPNYSTVRR